MNHKMHLYLMGGLVGAGVVLLFTGGANTFGGGWVSFVFLGLCMAMMFFMMRGMGGHGGMGDMGMGWKG